MPMYIEHVKIEVTPKDANLGSLSSVLLSEGFGLFKCERKALKYINSVVKQYVDTHEWVVWQPSNREWCIDNDQTHARVTIKLSEVRVIT